MLNLNNDATQNGFTELQKISIESGKPIVFWLGAGVGRWVGCPSWQDLAKRLHRNFVAYEPGYNKSLGETYINNNQFPELFEHTKNKNAKRYRSDLSSALQDGQPSAVFRRLTDALNAFEPLSIITTNVDRSLEKHFTNCTLIQKDNLELGATLLSARKPFLAKIHGTVDDFDSLVFSTKEYDRLKSDRKFIESLRVLVGGSHLVFVGYGLADKYFVNILQESEESKQLFGDGPHFAIMSGKATDIPDSVRQLIYLPGKYSDRRTALQIIEEISETKKPGFRQSIEAKPIVEFKSAHLLTEIFPPGTWSTSSTVKISARSDGDAPEQIIWIGDGITADEQLITNSTAMHDFVVSLMCFDLVYVPINLADRISTLLGGAVFEEVVKDDSIRFIYFKDQNVIKFENGDVLCGELGAIATVPDQDQTAKRKFVDRVFKPTPGREAEGKKLIDLIVDLTFEVETATPEFNVSAISKSLLLRQSIRKSLGISPGVSANKIPKWNAYPFLRLANLVQQGIACQVLEIPSMKLNAGASALAGPTFSSVIDGNHWTDQAASYVLAGNFDTNLSAAVSADPTLIRKILKFRDTEAGIAFRKEILDQLKIAAGSDVQAAINGNLKTLFPRALDNARRAMTALMSAPKPQNLPSLWSDDVSGSRTLGLWVQRSQKELRKIMGDTNLRANSQCPCGSGDILSDCCLR